MHHTNSYTLPVYGGPNLCQSATLAPPLPAIATSSTTDSTRTSIQNATSTTNNNYQINDGRPEPSRTGNRTGPTLVPISTVLNPEQAKRIEETIAAVIRNEVRSSQPDRPDKYYEHSHREHTHPGLNLGIPRNIRTETFTDLPENILENHSPPGSPRASVIPLDELHNNDVENNCYVKVEPIENNRDTNNDASCSTANQSIEELPSSQVNNNNANIPQVIAVQSNGAVHYIKIELDHTNTSQATINEPEEQSDLVTSGVNPGTSQIVSQVPADSTVGVIPTQQRRDFSGKPRNPYENGNAMDLPQLDEDIYIDTAELCRRIAYELKQHSIPQAVFAERVLCRSQGTLSDLLRNPKPWNKLKSGRETFRRMYSWLKQPLSLRLTFLDVAPSGAEGDPGEQDGVGGRVGDGSSLMSPVRAMSEPDGPDQRMSPDPEESGEASVSSTWNHPNKRILDPPPKKTRLVFTDIQKRTLQAIFKETQRPSKEMQQTIAEHLGLDLSTVQNFFMNARRRSRLGPQSDEPSPSQQIRPVTPPPSSPPPGKVGRPLKRMKLGGHREAHHTYDGHKSVKDMLNASTAEYELTSQSSSSANSTFNLANTIASVANMHEPMVSYPPTAPHQPLLTLPPLGPLPPPRDVPTPPALGVVTFSNAMNLNLNSLMAMSSPSICATPADNLSVSADTFLSIANTLAPLQPVRLTDDDRDDIIQHHAHNAS